MGCQSAKWKRAVQVAVIHPILEPCVVPGCERVAGRAQSQKLCPGKESHPFCVSGLGAGGVSWNLQRIVIEEGLCHKAGRAVLQNSR